MDPVLYRVMPRGVCGGVLTASNVLSKNSEDFTTSVGVNGVGNVQVHRGQLVERKKESTSN